MNTREILSNQVQDQWREKAPALALVDMLMDDYSMSKREALKDAARLRKAGRDAHYLAEAAKLLAKGSPDKKAIETIIRSGVLADVRATVTVMVVPGRVYPHCERRKVPTPKSTYWRSYILIGARRVLWIQKCISRHTTQPDTWTFAPDGDLINH